MHQIPGRYFQSLDRVLKRPGGALILTLSVPTLKEVRRGNGFRSPKLWQLSCRCWRPAYSACASFYHLTRSSCPHACEAANSSAAYAQAVALLSSLQISSLLNSGEQLERHAGVRHGGSHWQCLRSRLPCKKVVWGTQGDATVVGAARGLQRKGLSVRGMSAANPLVVYFAQVRAPARAAKYRVRTAQLRRWVQRRSPAAGFIDFDSLSLAPNGPPNTKSDKWVAKGLGFRAHLCRCRRMGRPTPSPTSASPVCPVLNRSTSRYAS